MKAWPEHHYARIRAFLAELEAAINPGAAADTAPAPAPTPPVVVAVNHVRPAAPLPAPPSPAPAAPPPAVSAPVQAPAPAPATPTAAGRFFAGVPWAGGEAARAAFVAPDITPPISVGLAPAAHAQVSPRAAVNPLLAATRSAIVTAGKAADVAPPPASESAGNFFRKLAWQK